MKTLTLKTLARNARRLASSVTLCALVGCNIAGGEPVDTGSFDTGSFDTGDWTEDTEDRDGDGWTVEEGDCNDANPAINPAATEIPDNSVDENCDGVFGTTDEPDPGTEDLDSDGYPSDVDCDDYDPEVNPGADEIPYDGKDNDCDGIVSNDGDGDGFDHEDFGGEDCDDYDPDVHPRMTEEIDGVDQDCSGNGAEVIMTLAGGDGVTWYVDGDVWYLTEGVHSTTSAFTMASGETMSFCATSSGENSPSFELVESLYASLTSSWTDGNGADCFGVVAD